MGKLLPRVEAFCRYYISNGGHGTKAAIEAGYAPGAAAAYASRLLKQPAVIAQLALLKAQYGQLPPPGSSNGGNGAGRPPAIHGEIFGPDKRQPEPNLNSEAILTRQFLIATGLRNLAMCMGDQDVPISRQLKYETKRKDGTVTEHIEVKTLMIRERNASAANAALQFLDAQLDKLPDGANPLGAADEGQRKYLEGLLAEKAAEIKKMIPGNKEPAST